MPYGVFGGFLETCTSLGVKTCQRSRDICLDRSRKTEKIEREPNIFYLHSSKLQTMKHKEEKYIGSSSCPSANKETSTKTCSP